MAIDGVKIIDSDDGYDIYNYIVENYKDGKNVNEIIASILKDEKDYCTNDFYTEIYWTSLAYSLWKIGHLSDEIKNKALKIIQKGANEFWTKIDSKAFMQRQKELGLLIDSLEKIGQVELEEYDLFLLAPASTLEDIYKQITRDAKIWGFKLNDTYRLIKSFENTEKYKRNLSVE